MHVPDFLYPFIFRWTLRSLPYFDYCEYAAANVGTLIPSEDPISILLDEYAGEVLLDRMVLLFLTF